MIAPDIPCSSPAEPLAASRRRSAVGWISIAMMLMILASDPSRAQSGWRLLEPEDGGAVERVRPRFVLQAPSATPSERLRFTLDEIDVSEFVERTPGPTSSNGPTSLYRWRSPVPLDQGEHRIAVLDSDQKEPLANFVFERVPPSRGPASNAVVRDGSAVEWEEEGDSVIELSPHTDGRLEGRLGQLEWDVTSPHTLNLRGSNPDSERPDAVLRFDRPTSATKRLGLRAVLGTVRNPRTFGRRRLIRMPSHRQILGAGVSVGAQEIHAFSNLGGGLPGASGERGSGQDLQAISWTGRWLDGRLGVSLLGFEAADRGDADPTGLGQRRERSEILALAFDARLSESWSLLGEFALSERRQHTGPAGAIDAQRIRDFTGAKADPRDAAFQLALEGALAGAEVELRARRVDARFLNPVDPGLQADREEAELVVDRRAERWHLELRALRAEDGTSRATSSNREDLLEIGGGFEIAGFDLQAHLATDRTDGPGLDADHDRWSLTLRRSLGGVRLTAQHGVTDVTSSSSVGTRTRRRDDSTRKSRLSFDWEAWRTDRSRLRLRVGGSSQSRDQLGRPSTETEEWFVDPTLELLGRRLRLNLRLGADRLQRFGERDERRETARLSMGFELPERRAIGVQTGFDWSDRTDRLRGRSESDRRWSLALTWAPEWRFGQ